MKQNVLVSGSGWKENKNMVYVTIMGKQRGDVAWRRSTWRSTWRSNSELYFYSYKGPEGVVLPPCWEMNKKRSDKQRKRDGLRGRVGNIPLPNKQNTRRVNSIFSSQEATTTTWQQRGRVFACSQTNTSLPAVRHSAFPHHRVHQLHYGDRYLNTTARTHQNPSEPIRTHQNVSEPIRT